MDGRHRNEAKLTAAEQEIEQLEQRKKTMETQLARCKSLSQDMENISRNHELTAALIDRLVERVDIPHDKQIQVKFRFQSEFQKYGEAPEPCSTM
ncbi:MAG: hypothetical protein VB071_06965 [Lawsonibacter sp.]|nr:hypothetical protein [Lawsonibacter sp.]